MTSETASYLHRQPPARPRTSAPQRLILPPRPSLSEARVVSREAPHEAATPQKKYWGRRIFALGTVAAIAGGIHVQTSYAAPEKPPVSAVKQSQTNPSFLVLDKSSQRYSDMVTLSFDQSGATLNEVGHTYPTTRTILWSYLGHTMYARSFDATPHDQAGSHVLLNNQALHMSDVACSPNGTLKMNAHFFDYQESAKETAALHFTNACDPAANSVHANTISVFGQAYPASAA